MVGSPLQKTIAYQLVAAVATGIATSQSGTAGTKLTLNGSLVSGGIATLDSGGAARRVIITSAGNDSTNTFTIIGTDRYARPQTEILVGANVGAAQSQKDFLTVTSITPTNNTTSTVTSGTNSVGSSTPMVVDAWVNPAIYGCGTVVNGTVNYTIEKAYDDLAPAYDLTVNSPTWYPETEFTAQSTSVEGNITGPCNLLRLTINSGTGAATARIIMPYVAGSY